MVAVKKLFLFFFFFSLFAPYQKKRNSRALQLPGHRVHLVRPQPPGVPAMRAVAHRVPPRLGEGPAGLREPLQEDAAASGVDVAEADALVVGGRDAAVAAVDLSEREQEKLVLR